MSVLTIFWAYGAYMALLGLLKFSLGALRIHNPAAQPYIGHEIYFLLSNLIFFITCSTFWKAAPSNTKRNDITSLRLGTSLLLIYSSLYAIGFTLYFWNALKLDYSGFVNFEGSAWGQVFFYSGATLIAITAARRRWIVAAVLSAPYVILSEVLAIRSFLALSLIPICVLLIMTPHLQQLPGKQTSTRTPFITSSRWPSRLLGIAVSAGALLYGVVGASLTKHGEVRLFEESIIEYHFIVTDALEREREILGTESLERFLWGLGSPVFKQAGIRYEGSDDPPAIFASYIDPYANRLSGYFHYPALWQADTFAAFRYWGLALAPIWALLLLGMERLVRTNIETWIILLPVSCWISFMFARGASGNASISISYVLLLQTAILIVKRFLRQPSRGAAITDGRSLPQTSVSSLGERPVQ